MCIDKKTAELLYDSGKAPTVAKILELDAKNEELNARIATLSKNSSNSSKPPSSDIVKPPHCDNNKKEKRRIGAQEGHPKWERKPFSAEEIIPIEHTLACCPDCNEPLLIMANEPPRTMQQVELVNPVVEKLEHRSAAYWCARCNRIHFAPFSSNVYKEGFFKPQITTTVCFLKYLGRMSFSSIQKYVYDAFDIKVTEGFLAKVIQKGSNALQPCYDELLALLPSQRVVNADETGHKENGKKFWTWTFRTSLFALYKIDESRGSDVIIEVLGKEFDGVLGCDYFSAYRKYMKDFNIIMQFCLAHLIRDVKFLADFPNASVKIYGRRLLRHLRKLFQVFHQQESLGQRTFQIALEKSKIALIRAATTHVPSRKEARNMARRFEENGEAYFTFITTPGVDPTNNSSEQALRFIVQYRYASQGTRSPNGRIACERFWTVIQTCALQGRSAFQFIKQAIDAFVHDAAAPSLVPLNSP